MAAVRLCGTGRWLETQTKKQSIEPRKRAPQISPGDSDRVGRQLQGEK